MAQESKLFLFISIDITGSTAFKNSFKAKDRFEIEHPWVSVFKTFYDEFIKLFNENLEDKVHLTSEDHLWKSIGDEIVIKKQIIKLDDVPYILSKCIKTIKEYREIYFTGMNLNLKGTAWLAGFPVINTEIISGNKVDYIGPSFDMGFRLAKKYPTTTRFVISVDLAYVIGQTHQSPHQLDLYYEGEVILKGALSNKPYPLFYIYVSNELEDQRMRMLNRSRLELDKVSRFSEYYIKSLNEPFQIILPYVVEKGKLVGGELPPQHRELLDPLGEELIDPEEVKKLEEIREKIPDALNREIKIQDEKYGKAI